MTDRDCDSGSCEFIYSREENSEVCRMHNGQVPLLHFTLRITFTEKSTRLKHIAQRRSDVIAARRHNYLAISHLWIIIDQPPTSASGFVVQPMCRLYCFLNAEAMCIVCALRARFCCWIDADTKSESASL
jgi:hypothetical protein